MGKRKGMKTEDEGGKIKVKPARPKTKNDERDLDAMLKEIEHEEAHGKEGEESEGEDVPF